jgi:uncharacterized delta-60 repeat protein
MGAGRALQPDGKILVACRDGAKELVARLNPNGSLDATFGNSGRNGVGGGVWEGSLASIIPAGVHPLAELTDSANHVTGVMVKGTASVGGLQSFAVVKLTAAGLPDATFGTGGTAVVNVGGVNDTFGGLAVTPAGGVVLVGQISGATLPAAVVALTPSGQLDTTFNGTGYRLDTFPAISAQTRYDAVTIQPTAGGGYDIVVAGAIHLTDDNRWNGLVDRYTSAGQLDATFGTGGITVARDAYLFNDVGLEADGSIVVAGVGYHTNPDGSISYPTAVGHLSADGTLDTTFGTDGTGIAQLPAGWGRSLAIAPDGRIVVAGRGSPATIARLTAP